MAADQQRQAPELTTAPAARQRQAAACRQWESREHTEALQRRRSHRLRLHQHRVASAAQLRHRRCYYLRPATRPAGESTQPDAECLGWEEATRCPGRCSAVAVPQVESRCASAGQPDDGGHWRGVDEPTLQATAMGRMGSIAPRSWRPPHQQDPATPLACGPLDQAHEAGDCRQGQPPSRPHRGRDEDC